MLPGRKVRFVLAAIVLAFAAAEIASRIAGVPVEKTYFKNVADPAWGEDPELFWVPEGAFEAPYRSARDHDDGPLIYTFGGSIVRGFGVDVPFAKSLEKALAADPRFAGVQVVNFGSDGYTSHQALVLARRACDVARPDLVIECNAWNDHENAPYNDREVRELNRGEGKRILHTLSRSRFFSLMRRQLTRSSLDGLWIDDISRWKHRVDLPDHEANLIGFAQLAQRTGAGLIFLAQVIPDPATRKSLAPYFTLQRNVAERTAGARFVDPRSEIEAKIDVEFAEAAARGEGPSNSWIIDNCHPTQKGHDYLAEVLTPAATDLLAEKYRNGRAD
ncbi:MAG: SGNH/GDSL hydrolase family protein [Deltaproteobacteria bacterium]|nr:SGNH/GDSL hydrolase family protein [Deltaproteobacteria bacterium]MCB9488191.1 SGNH/GDSL hydrolase family protein [Deltaproteobacteria bacterium]